VQELLLWNSSEGLKDQRQGMNTDMVGLDILPCHMLLPHGEEEHALNLRPKGTCPMRVRVDEAY